MVAKNDEQAGSWKEHYEVGEPFVQMVLGKEVFQRNDLTKDQKQDAGTPENCHG